jgi:predicted MFS family arabinose efflux permease
MSDISAVPAPSRSDASVISLTKERLLLWALAAIQFTNIVDFMVMMPLGPQLTQLFALTDAQFGVLVSAYTLAAGVSGVLVSGYIDQFSRRSLMLFIYAGFGMATLACALSPSYITLLIARVVAGIFGGVLSALVQTMVADTVPYARRGRAMGVIASAFSLAAVAGVPGSLVLAATWGWHAPFFILAALVVPVWYFAFSNIPPLKEHLNRTTRASTLSDLRMVLSEVNHWRAFLLSVFMMSASFCIIPYVTIYLSVNLAVSPHDVPLVYLVGGAATLVSSRLWGVLADRWGKVRTFRLVAAGAVVPMMVLTHLHTASFALILIVTTVFFVFVSGRMVPGMSIISAAAVQPSVRGAFMSINGAIQSAAMGVASWVGGMIISRDEHNRVADFGYLGWLALGLTLVALWLVGRIKKHDLK